PDSQRGINLSSLRISRAMATAAFETILPSLVPFPAPRPVHRLLSRLLGIDEIARIYEALRTSAAGGPLIDRLLDHLTISCSLSEVDRAHIPVSGSAIVTVNHPFGLLESAVLASILSKRRPDVRFLANRILTIIPELRDLLIPVDPMTGRRAAP